MARSNPALDVVEAVSVAIGRLLPVIDHIPDHFGKWVPPIKKAVAENAKLAAMLGTAGGAAKALRGRFNLVDAVMTGLNTRTLGASKKMSVLGSIGLLAVSKIRRGMLDASKEAKKLGDHTKIATDRLEKAGKVKPPKQGRGGGGAGLGNARNLIAGLGAYKLIQGSIEGFKGAFDVGGQLVDQSKKTGIAVDQMMILNQAAKDSGIEDVTGAVNKMQVSLIDAVAKGTGPAAEGLALLGLNARELVNQAPIDQIKAIGAALQSIKNPALRTDTVRNIFGKSGADLMPLLDDNSALDAAAGSIGKQSAILAANAAKFDQISDRLNRAGLKSQGFFVGVAEVVLPLMDKITERMDKADFATVGARFGEGLKDAAAVFIGAFQNPLAIADALHDALLWAIASGANTFLNSFIGVANTIKAYLKDAFDWATGKPSGGKSDHPLMIDDKDFFGADKLKESMQKNLDKLRATGEAVIEKWGDKPPQAPGARSRFADFATASTGSSLRSSGLAAASMAGTLIGSSASGASPFDFSKVANLSRSGVRTGPILSHSERRAFEDAGVGRGEQRAGSTAGAFGVIHAGDAARRKNAERERERERLKKEGSVERSNELLTKIVDSTTKTAEAFE